MKLHELDGAEVLPTLPRWEALSPAARAALVQIPPAQNALMDGREGMVERTGVAPPHPGAYSVGNAALTSIRQR